ncbi:MAG: energy-coupling factor ABC transporter ATP-binding protein [Thermoflexales bacterium]|nr:energy-coupling factor ABC transporter ATP-binding protein [Thermoflexales bacterium]
MIRIEGLSYRFRGSETYALRNLSLEIEPREFVVITGPSGCGKSTLALAIGGYLFRQFDGQAEGHVTVGGLDVRDSPIHDVAQLVGLVQQNPEAQFCTLTVGDEVAFGLENRCLSRAEIRERMAWALSIVGAEHLQGRLLASLSGGEKQKVAIAAMMAAKPQVLIFDEPTSNLDPTATAEIFGVIEHIREKAGITVIVIEHKVGYLRRFEPRLIQMQDGQIVFDGQPTPNAQVLNDPVPQSRPPGIPASQAPLLRVENLHAGYNGRSILRDLALEVHPGEFVSVMGDNGSGKTTFLHCLLGLHRPSQGRIEVLGHDTRHTPVSQLARQAGLLFQNPDHQLFADSVWEEAVFAPLNFGALDGATEARVGDLLARCGLGDRHDDHPYRLSYGQKRRLNLISVLSYAPRLILLDEVLIGQDPANAGFLLDLLQEHVAQGGAVIMVNHAPEVTRRYASRLLFFNDGRIAIDAPNGQAYDRLQALGKSAYVC